MSPLMIGMLLDYYSLADGYDGPDGSAQKEAISHFETYGMITPQDIQKPDSRTIYKLTPKGVYYVEHLCSISLPVTTYAIP